MSSGFWRGIHNACWITGGLIYLFSFFASPYNEQGPLVLLAIVYVVVAEWAGYAAKKAARREYERIVGRNLPAPPEARRGPSRAPPKSHRKF